MLRQRPVQSGPDQRHLDEVVEMAGLQRGVLAVVGEAEHLLRLAWQIRVAHGADRGQGQQGRRGAAALAGQRRQLAEILAIATGIRLTARQAQHEGSRYEPTR